jgi:hypothetical protein
MSSGRFNAAVVEEQRALAFIRDHHVEYSRCMSEVFLWVDTHTAWEAEVMPDNVTYVPLPSKVGGCLSSAAAYQRRVKAFIDACPPGSACHGRHGLEIREMQWRRERFLAIAQPLATAYDLL